jgi:cobalt-precorrin 5A hydrolase / cobalt-factor III methyltransferase / precorrin-3B C17-methyltransferase
VGTATVIALVAATAAGRAKARHLASVLPEAQLLPGRPGEALPDAFARASGIVVFLATGIAVRLLAPLLSDKRRDPGVVCVDDAGRFAIALTGGHAGGANRLAERVAGALGAAPVITTASEATGLPGLEALGQDNGFGIEPGGDLAAVGAALVGGERVALVSDRRRPIGPLPPNVVGDRGARSGPAIVIDDRLGEPPRPAVVYRPPSLVVGVGASRGASADQIMALIDGALADAGLAGASVAALASVDAKAGEPGLVAAARVLARPLRLHPAGALAGIDVPNPSETVRLAVGTPSVAEAAALREAGTGAELVVPKRRSAVATVAVARRAVRGRLALVGLGPGDEALLPPLARRALVRAEVVVGLARYVESVRHLLRPGTRTEPYRLGEELKRCQRAIGEAAAGGSVALVSSGDPGVYAMASPALEQPGIEHVDVEVVPGVTAAHAAAALAGSPLGHDHCSISLSDLLTPWEAIRGRVRAAAEADFVVSFYNPRSRERDWQLDEARELLLERRPGYTPVAMVSDAHRPGQRVTLTTLDQLDAAEASMATTVIVGSSQTRMVDGRMVTPRGYRAAVEAVR